MAGIDYIKDVVLPQVKTPINLTTGKPLGPVGQWFHEHYDPDIDLKDGECCCGVMDCDEAYSHWSGGY
jgi:hypothetical protein